MSLIDEISTPFLQTVAEKIINNRRLTHEEGLQLLNTQDAQEIEEICKLANYVRAIKHGDVVHYAASLFIYPTNLCELNCQFCSFYAKPGWKKAWFSTPAEIEEKIRKYVLPNNQTHSADCLDTPNQLTEIHIVGGLWRDCNLDYYEELFTRIKKIDPKLHIKALTPVEYHFLADMHGISIQEVFQKMMAWGLGSLPGGGAEILVEEIRQKIAPGKISSDLFLSIHELAHNLGLPSNVTMLFGHIETNAHIITHLCRVRELQDKTGGFKAFIPLKFGEENNALGRRKKELKEKNIALIYAVSRLMIDNIPHLKILWNYIGIECALRMLHCGGNDLSSTNTEEKVITMAGAPPIVMNCATMEQLIRQIDRTPRLTHSGDV